MSAVKTNLLLVLEDAFLSNGCPVDDDAWLGRLADRIITVVTAQGIEAGAATTAGRGPKDESPVAESEAPNE